ncbi:MAG: phosphatidylserine decarboxylase [Proteobacteria bacterium]|nr:phosphatidylserine decarboxylase [Pseudomonadota bacterium]
MAKSFKEWLASDVEANRQISIRSLSEHFFFRDPVRPRYSDSSYMFSPADGVILYQREISADEPLVEIKGREYTLQQAMRNDRFRNRCLVIGIFMTSYDVHVNRVPYSGILSYQTLPPLHTLNRPMLEVEDGLMRGHGFASANAGYLFTNQRILNTVQTPRLGIEYYILQIADLDVATIQPFDLRQGRPVFQNHRFSQIRFGSQVDLIIPLSEQYEYETLIADTWHVEAGMDALIRLVPAKRHPKERRPLR